MTFEEVKNLQISNIISNSSEMKTLVKQCLSIVDTATAKDNEIVMWIGGAVSDMVRQGINVSANMSDEYVQGAIVMYVKANFGMTDIKEKENAQKSYNQICNNLSLSSKYKLEVDINA